MLLLYNSCVSKRLKVYTKAGDFGTTSLFGGERVGKESLRIRAYGEVDELNCWMGMIQFNLNKALAEIRRRQEVSKTLTRRQHDLGGKSKVDFQKSLEREFINLSKKLSRIQNELFVLGSDLSTPHSIRVKVPRVKRSFALRLEKEIDGWWMTLPQLKNFILPGGGAIASKVHLARTVARRAERSIVEVANDEKINKNAQVYINRLSDWLFTLARYVTKLEGVKEIIWKGRGN